MRQNYRNFPAPNTDPQRSSESSVRKRIISSTSGALASSSFMDAVKGSTSGGPSSEAQAVTSALMLRKTPLPETTSKFSV